MSQRGGACAGHAPSGSTADYRQLPTNSPMSEFGDIKVSVNRNLLMFGSFAKHSGASFWICMYVRSTPEELRSCMYPCSPLRGLQPPARDCAQFQQSPRVLLNPHNPLHTVQIPQPLWYCRAPSPSRVSLMPTGYL